MLWDTVGIMLKTFGLAIVGISCTLLSACSRGEDRFSPRIVITSSSSNGVTATREFLVQGYVIDDQAVTGLTANGKALPVGDGTRKIVNFEFKSQLDKGSKKGIFIIRANDASNHVSSVEKTVILDRTNPTIKIKSFRRNGKLITLSGIATDNHSILQVLVDGNRLNISPDRSVEFYAETTGTYADLVVMDSVGNQVSKRLR